MLVGKLGGANEASMKMLDDIIGFEITIFKNRTYEHLAAGS